MATTGLVVLGSTHTSGCPWEPDGIISLSSPLYQMVQGQTHLELAHSNRIHSKYKTALSRGFLLIFILHFLDSGVPNPIICWAAHSDAICVHPAIGAALLLPYATQCSCVESRLDTTNYCFRLQDRTWSWLLKLKGSVFTLVAKHCSKHYSPYFM